MVVVLPSMVVGAGGVYGCGAAVYGCGATIYGCGAGGVYGCGAGGIYGCGAGGSVISNCYSCRIIKLPVSRTKTSPLCKVCAI